MSNRICAALSRRAVSSPATPVPSSARSTAAPRRANRSSSRNVKICSECCGSRKGRLRAPFFILVCCCAFTEQLTQFFPKTCGCVQTHFEQSGRRLYPADGVRSAFSQARCYITIAGRPMSLDTPTLYIVATMVAAMLGAMLLLFGKQENIRALKWWGSAYLLGAASVGIWTVTSGTLDEVLSLALNAVGFIACGMVWNASRVFHGRKPNLPGLVLGAIAWIAAAMTLAPPASMMRVTIGAGIVAFYAALTATELWTERRRPLQRRWPLIVVPVMHGFVLMLPILLGSLLDPHDGKFATTACVPGFSS